MKKDKPTPVFTIEPPNYRYAKHLGANRPMLDPHYKLLIMSHQWVGGHFFCAYGGLTNPIRPPRELLPEDNTAGIGHLDHIIPKTLGGRENPLNLQYLSRAYNTTSFKHDKKTFYGSFIVAVKRETWTGPNFYSLIDQFLWFWSKKRQLCFGWPFTLRDPKSKAPLLPGWDLHQKCFASMAECLVKIMKLRARNTGFWLAQLENPILIRKVEAIFESVYHYPLQAAVADPIHRIEGDSSFKSHCHLV